MAVRWVQREGMPYPLADVSTPEALVDFGTLIRERTEAMSFDRYADFLERTTGMSTGQSSSASRGADGRTASERYTLRAVGENDGQVYYERMFTSLAQAEAAQRVFERSGQVADSGLEVRWNVAPGNKALDHAPGVTPAFERAVGRRS